ncbi:hypothetical protein, partial [Escherichia marmotae]
KNDVHSDKLQLIEEIINDGQGKSSDEPCCGGDDEHNHDHDSNEQIEDDDLKSDFENFRIKD